MRTSKSRPERPDGYASIERTIDSLNDSVEGQYRNNPSASLSEAQKALKLARRIGDRERVGRSLLAEGMCHWALSDHVSASRCFESSLAIALEVGCAELEGRVLHWTGRLYHERAEYATALEWFASALRIACSTGDRREEAFVLNSIANSLGGASSFDRSLEKYRSARAIFEELDHAQGLFFVTNNIGRIYLALGDAENALAQFRQLPALATRFEDRVSEANSLVNTGMALQRLGRLDEAAVELEKALALSREIGSTRNESYLHLCIAELHERRGNLAEAERTLLEGLAIARRIGNFRQWTMLAELAAFRIRQEDYSNALELLTDVLESQEASQELGLRFQCHERLSICYENLGDSTLALEHHKEFIRLQEESIGREQQRAMIEMQMREEIERAEKEREALRSRNEQLQLEMAQKTAELTALALHLVEKNQFLDSLRREMSGVVHSNDGATRPAVRGMLRQVEGSIDAENEWNAFERQFEQVHRDLLRRLSQEHPDLTRTELKVCALLKINLSTKESADILATSIKTIESHRYNIRKKLAVPTEVKLTTYFASL